MTPLEIAEARAECPVIALLIVLYAVALGGWLALAADDRAWHRAVRHG